MLAIFILSSAVSAADVDVMQVPDSGDIDESLVISEDIIINEGTFSDLAAEIGDGGNITLEKDIYTYDIGSTIRIKTPGVIDGNGAVIDMANSDVGVFFAAADGIVIKNINFLNVNNNYFGGAIHFWHSGAVENCNFINCNAYMGSAVYMSSGIVENCNIINNTNQAAAVFIDSGTVRNCSFTGNTAFEAAGAAVNGGNVENCNFDNNSAERDGGALWVLDGAVNNCNFNSNYAGRDGGAVWIWKGSIDGCNFNENQAYNDGGAVYIDKKAAITNSNLNDNDALFGGAVWMEAGNVDSCNFKDNSAVAYGGAVYMMKGAVENSSFDGDASYVHHGDAVFIHDENYAVKNCDFANMDCESAIGSYKNGTVEGCTFEDEMTVEIVDNLEDTIVKD